MSQSDVTSKSDDNLNSELCDNVRQLINRDDLSAIFKGQKTMLDNLEKTNAMLLNCNNISENHHGVLLSKFRRHTVVLQDMKKDLQSIHARIRRLKSLLHEKNPESWLVIEENTVEEISSKLPSINN